MSAKEGKRLGLSADQTGLMSIIVTMILIIVVGLIVLGFASVARHNQRETLDSEQGTQAYYAAETGLNQVSKAVLGNPSLLPADASSNCSSLINDVTDFPQLNKGHIDDTTQTAYTCALVDLNVDSIDYSSISLGDSAVAPLNVTVGPLASLTFKWNADDGTDTDPALCKDTGNTLPATPDATDPTSWGCDYAALEADIVKMPTGTLSGLTLANQTESLFFLPKATGTALTISNFGDNGARSRRAASACSTTTHTCQQCVDFTGGAQGTNYYLRLVPIYKNAKKVDITGSTANCATPPTTPTTEKFSGAQALIDITGKAQDQLRRIQAKVPLTTGTGDVCPAGGVCSSSNVCKYFATAPGELSATFQDTSTTDCVFTPGP